MSSLCLLLARQAHALLALYLQDREEGFLRNFHGPDLLHASLAGLLAYLKNNYGEEFALRCPVLLLASKAREDAEDSQGVEAFIGDNLPATLAALQDWQGRYTLRELDVGEFEYAEDGEPLLYSPKFDDMAKIFRWIYFQFTRYAVLEPFLARLWKSVRKSAS